MISQNKRTPILSGIMDMEEATYNKMEKLFRTAFHIAIFEKPFTDFAGLVELQNLNSCQGCQVGDNNAMIKLPKTLLGTLQVYIWMN